MTEAPDDLRPPAMLAVDLAWSTLPTWLRLTAAHRFSAVAVADPERWTWHIWYRIALDHSGLDIVPRNVARVLVDWHGNAHQRVTVRAGDIASRVPCHPDHALRGLSTLTAERWATVERRPGLPSTVTLLCPVDMALATAPTPAPRAGVTPAPRAGGPAPRAGVPRATRGTQERRSKGALRGATRVSSENAVPRGARSTWLELM